MRPEIRSSLASKSPSTHRSGSRAPSMSPERLPGSPGTRQPPRSSLPLSSECRDVLGMTQVIPRSSDEADWYLGGHGQGARPRGAVTTPAGLLGLLDLEQVEVAPRGGPAGRPKSAQHLARASAEPCSTIVRGATFFERLTDEATHARQRLYISRCPLVRCSLERRLRHPPRARRPSSPARISP